MNSKLMVESVALLKKLRSGVFIKQISNLCTLNCEFELTHNYAC